MVTELRQEFSFNKLLKFAGLARSSYYYEVKQKGRKAKYEEIKKRIKEIFHEHKECYGYERISLILNKENIKINRKTVYRLMKELGIRSKVRRKRYVSYRGEIGKSAPNTLNRRFKALNPHEKLVTDITEMTAFGKRIYVSPLMDLNNKEIIACTISHNPNGKMVKEMLEEGFKKMGKKEKVLIHTDQGIQYKMKAYIETMKKYKAERSMSRKGNCLDNAVIENFFGHLKSELDVADCKTAEEVIRRIRAYIYYYNHKRIQAKLGGLSPVEYRLKMAKAS